MADRADIFTASDRANDSALDDDTKTSQSVRVCQEERDAIVNDSLPIICGIVMGLYLLLGVSHIFVVPEPHNISLALSTLLAAGVISGIFVFSYRSRIPDSAAHPALFAASFLVLANSTFHIYLLGQTHQATNFALLLMSWGLMVLSVRWFIIQYCMIGLAWLGLLQFQSHDPELVVHYTFMILSAAGIGVLGFAIRYNAYNKVISYRLSDAKIQKSLRKALDRAVDADRAERRSDAKDTFIAHISRELRTPLNSIVGFSEAIQQETQGPIGNEKYREYINDIQDAGLHVTSILEDLHDLVQIEKDDLEIKLSTFHVDQSLDACLLFLSRRAEAKNISLVKSCDPALIYLATDETRFRQILSNLLTNAVKFTSQGEIFLSGKIEPDGRILFEVRDTGAGMSEAELKKALSPVWPAISAPGDAEIKGSGLGLSVTTRLVKLLGGTFELSSVEGEGTTARVWLPQSCRAYDRPMSGPFNGELDAGRR